MGFFRYHIRNLNKLFITDYIEKDLDSPGNDLSDRDYSKSLHIMDIYDLLNQMNFTLSNVFKFEKSFFSSDITLINKNDLRYDLVYKFDDIIDKSSKGITEITEFPIANENQTLFANDSLDLVRV